VAGKPERGGARNGGLQPDASLLPTDCNPGVPRTKGGTDTELVKERHPVTTSIATTELPQAGAVTIDGSLDSEQASEGASPMPATMRAIRQDSLGGPDVLRVAEVARPEPGPTEVLVRVHAAGVNPVDWKTRAGGGFLGAPPFTVGWDVAGVVETVGDGVTRFAAGDRVFGMPRFPREAAAYAEYVTSPSRQLARTPDRLSDVEAAALPLAALTAWQALVDTANVQPGQRLLVHAGAGGVGHLAVQIAKARGAYVIATARASRHAFLAELGVDEAIDHTRQGVGQTVRGADVVLDLVGGETGLRSLPALRDGGLLISVPSSADVEPLREAARERVRVTGILVEPDRRGMDAIAALVQDGLLRVRVAKTFPLGQAARAHELGESGQTGGGKLVLTID
jgi:NADPH:quinone reductase-like Zn-dependent oxidoreductase